MPRKTLIGPEPSTTIPATSLDERCINALRFLAVDAVQKANSGHPGLPLGAAAMARVLWTRFLKHYPANPDWLDRAQFSAADRFGASAPGWFMREYGFTVDNACSRALALLETVGKKLDPARL